jgi:hypothetical protein
MPHDCLAADKVSGRGLKSCTSDKPMLESGLSTGTTSVQTRSRRATRDSSPRCWTVSSLVEELPQMLEPQTPSSFKSLLDYEAEVAAGKVHVQTPGVKGDA